MGGKSSKSSKMTVPKTAEEGEPGLFRPFKMGPFELKHRIVYAPLTRCRAFGTVPQALAAEYYGQRATDGGFMLSEGTVISETGHGYPCTPGINRPEQVEAWKPITKAVKDKGAVFFCQIWHCGRASHPHYQPDEALPIGPSAIAISDGTQLFSLKSMAMEDYPVPRALETAEIAGLVEDYAQAARNAIAAGFDGVEIHGANGYLIDEFLKTCSNTRTDAYGGCIENRCRFALEVVAAVVAAVGAERVGIRLSPFAGFLVDVGDNPYTVNTYLLEQLNPLGLAYVHLVEPRAGGNDDRDPGTMTLAPFRAVYQGTLIAAGGYNAADGHAAVEAGRADLVCYGRHFLANPDMVQRFRVGAELNKYDRATFYSQGPEGYIDYPTMEAAAAK